MHRILLSLIVSLTALPLWAYPCSFGTECYETEPCAESAFEIDIRIDDKTVTTGFGDLTIVAAKRAQALTTIFATGNGMEVLISVTPEAARLSAHINTGPQIISYLGQCEGAF